MTTTILTVFIPTFLFVSLTPGMCMTLSMSLGMTIGFRRTFWMMYGELLGVAIVAVVSVVGVAAVTLRYPGPFLLLKLLGVMAEARRHHQARASDRRAIDIMADS